METTEKLYNQKKQEKRNKPDKL